MHVNNKEILGVVDTAAHVSVINSSLFEQVVPRPKLQGRIILKGADKYSELEARLAEKIKIQIGITVINWNMVVANITDSLILGIYFLEKQRAVIDLSDYSIRLNGQIIPPVMINTTENQYVQIYRVKSTKLQSPWEGPYLITAVKPPMLYQIKDRISESWIHHDRLKLCEDREFPIWLKRQRMS